METSSSIETWQHLTTSDNILKFCIGTMTGHAWNGGRLQGASKLPVGGSPGGRLTRVAVGAGMATGNDQRL